MVGKRPFERSEVLCASRVLRAMNLPFLGFTHLNLSFRPERARFFLHVRACKRPGPRSGEISLRSQRRPPAAYWVATPFRV